MEESALAHVLCSPDTSYGDVAGQMYIVQALVSSSLYSLFQQLAANGAHVIKYPRSGRPAKKLFRFSFVEGMHVCMYVYICMYICLYVSMYIYACMYACM